MIDKVRELALKILYKIDKEQAYSNIVLNQILKENKQLKTRDKALISEITYGVTNWKLTIDTIISKYSKIKIKKISPWILNILRMGIYQIIWLDKIPKSAAVNESVNLSKRYGHSSSSNFVNAILRKITKEDYIEISKIQNPTERISKMYSMPIWIVEQMIKERKEIKTVEKICKQLSERPYITVRRNNLKINKKEFEKMLTENNLKYQESEVNPDFYIIEGAKDIEHMEMHQKGYLTVQDVSAGLAVYNLEPKPNETILDACAAPGGKTTYIAEIMQNKGTIEAWDIHEHRTKLIEENAKRLGIDIIKIETQNASIYHPEYQKKFNKILLDVPCLGIGVIRHKPDIKWQRKPEDVEKITKIQKQILKNCTKYLKEKGTIIYSTCSILQEENQKVIQEFIEENSEFTYENTEILPTKYQDGFFISKIKRKDIT